MEYDLGPLRMLGKRVRELGDGEKVIRPQSVGEDSVDKNVQQLGRVILNEEPGLVTSCIKGMLGVKIQALSSDKCRGEMFLELIQQLIELDGNPSLTKNMKNESLMEVIYDHLRRFPCFIVLDNNLALNLSFYVLLGMFVFISYLRINFN